MARRDDSGKSKGSTARVVPAARLLSPPQSVPSLRHLPAACSPRAGMAQGAPAVNVGQGRNDNNMHKGIIIIKCI